MSTQLRTVLDKLRALAKGALGIVLGVPLAGLAAAMLLGPPLMLAWETIDLIRMRETAVGQVQAVSIKRGGHGTSRARIEYTFVAAGQPFRSDRFLPGIAANTGTWTGGSSVSDDFPLGKAVPVYYSRRDPSLCALEYGWFQWSLGLTAIWCGLILRGVSLASWFSDFLRTFLACIGLGTVVYGFGLLFLGPPVVRVVDLTWHGGVWLGAIVSCAVYFHWRRRRYGRNPDEANGNFPD